MTIKVSNWISVLLLSLAAMAGSAAAAGSITVTAKANGSAVQVNAEASLRAPLSLIWQTLTDYEHLPAFIPGMKTSRVVARRGTASIVEQTGSAGALFFAYPIDVTVESVEYHPRTIEIHVLKGNIKQLDGRYDLDPSATEPHTFRLRWTGLIQPGMELPSFITIPLMRASIEDQFTGMVKEIERRESERRRLLAAAD
jgi:ribosome-associated toxin RatA of RatAB toxin-antitoxin module